jgi:general secretion pathway protein A
MYKAFFGFTHNPFELTPDPAYFVSTKRHNEALAALYYGVRWHKGFVVVTGEVGTGKTLLLRCLLRLLKESEDISYAYLFNSRLTANEFLEYIVADFGLPAPGKNKSELLFELSQFLLSRRSRRMTTVLIVDEAHHLSAELLEEIRLLSDLETADDKLLQIVLVGQPELDGKLDSIGLRQLKQRISLRAQLGPLDLEETKAYVTHRLQIAGSGEECVSIFSPEAIEAVYRYSKGLPRLINTICENGLVAAYARQAATVTESIIEDVAREFRLGVVSAPDGDGTRAQAEAEMQRAARALLELLDKLRTPSANEMDLIAAHAAELGKHESHI